MRYPGSYVAPADLHEEPGAGRRDDGRHAEEEADVLVQTQVMRAWRGSTGSNQV
jgi:hypothetical protein